MKPSSIAKWVALHAAALEPDLVLFARRPDYSRPDPWRDYEQALQSIRQSLGDTPLGVILPPVSTFDPRGISTLEEERTRATSLAAPAPVLDLTPAFRDALPLPGVVLRTRSGRQQLVRLPDEAILTEGRAPPMHPGQPALAAEIVAAFEADSGVAEPLFFDGGHPDAEGFVIFTDAVAAWIEANDLL
jgi:lysophospholipase L1-like esterase